MAEIRCVRYVVSFFCRSRLARDSKKARVPSVQFELGTPSAHDRHREKGRHSAENMATTSPSAMEFVRALPPGKVVLPNAGAAFGAASGAEF